MHLFGAMRAGSARPGAADVLQRHLDADQVRAMEGRGAEPGPTAYYLLEIEWPELYRRTEALRTSGVAATDPRVRRLVARMDELSALFSGGNRDVSHGVRAAWREDPAAMSGDPGAPVEAWRALSDYCDEARRPLS